VRRDDYFDVTPRMNGTIIADMAKQTGSAGKKELSMAMVQRMRARFRVPADLLIPPPKLARRAPKRAAA
jgi:hypothetical protein